MEVGMKVESGVRAPQLVCSKGATSALSFTAKPSLKPGIVEEHATSMLAPAAGTAHPHLRFGTLQPRRPSPLSQWASRVRVGRRRQQYTPVRSQQQDAPDSKASAHLRRHYSGLRKEAEVGLLLAAVKHACRALCCVLVFGGRGRVCEEGHTSVSHVPCTRRACAHTWSTL